MVIKQSEPTLGLPEGDNTPNTSSPDSSPVPDLTPTSSPELTLPPEVPLAGGMTLPPLSLESSPSVKSKKYYWIILVIVATTLLAFAAYWLKGRRPRDVSPTLIPVASSLPRASVTPSPIPSPSPLVTPLKREEITLEILNGTSVSGLAGKTKAEFEALGYTVASVGNASEATSSSQLLVQRDLEPTLTKLIEDVSDKLGITKITGYLESGDKVSARLILGGN